MGLSVFFQLDRINSRWGKRGGPGMQIYNAQRSLRALLFCLFTWMLLASSAWACGPVSPADLDPAEFCGKAASIRAHLSANRPTSCPHCPGQECQCESGCGEMGLSGDCNCGMKMPEAPPLSETRIPQPIVLVFRVSGPQPKNSTQPLVSEVGQGPAQRSDSPPIPPPR